MEGLLLALDALLVLGLAAWMIVAVADNWRHPKLNEDAVAVVVRFDAMAREFPDEFALLAHRRIEDAGTIRLMFRAIRLAETVAAMALSASVILLALASIGLAGSAFATGAALLSVAYFASIWAAFVIGGNYFAYWYCHQWAQSNHLMLLFWSLFVFIILLN
ncbi:MAG: DUF2165 family protein [Pseudomonadota bacterium]